MNKKIIWGILGVIIIIIALVSMNVLQENAKEAKEKRNVKLDMFKRRRNFIIILN